MSTAAVNGLLGAINGAISGSGSATGAGSELFIKASTVNLLRSKLESARESLVTAQNEMQTIASSAVGGSPVGAALAHHASLADARLRETIDAINNGLERYDGALATSLSQIEGADERAAADASAGESVIAEATGPTGSGVSG